MILDSTYHSALDAIFGFVGYEQSEPDDTASAKAHMKTAPHQSRNAKYPGSFIASRELGVSRGHLHAVLSGKRESKSLMTQWSDWLRRNPEFELLQKNPRTRTGKARLKQPA